jgi:lactam utilization protein B
MKSGVRVRCGRFADRGYADDGTLRRAAAGRDDRGRRRVAAERAGAMVENAS